MKTNRVALLFSAGWICALAVYPAYGASLKDGNEQIETYLEKLRDNIVEEEKAVESLKKRYEDILKKKEELKLKEQMVQEKQKTQEKESKKPDIYPSSSPDPDSELKTLKSAQYSLEQKNKELLNSLEQSMASIQKKNKTIEKLKKTGAAPAKKEEITIRQTGRKSPYSEEGTAAKKQVDKLQKEKAALEGRLKALKEENKNLLAHKPIQPQAAEEIDVRQKKSVVSKGADNKRIPPIALNQKDKPGILKSFMDKARRLDSWWREKVW